MSSKSSLAAEKPSLSSLPSPDGSEKTDLESNDSELSDNNEVPKRQPRTLVQMPLTDLDKGLVGWDSPSDLDNPKNWSTGRKWRTLSLVMISVFMLPLNSTLFAPGEAYVAAEFHETSKMMMSLWISIFVCGFAWGPMFIHAPLSELYGRKYVIAISNFVFALFSLGCALSRNSYTLLICRFFGGFLGSAGMVVGGGVISDLFPKERVGKASSLFSLGPLLGPAIGPVAGGFMSQSIGWRWSFRIMVIFGMTISILCFAIGEETHAGRLLVYKTRRLRKSLGRPELQSAMNVGKVRSPQAVFWFGVSRPLALLVTVPYVTFLSIYSAFVFSFLYIFMTSIPGIYREIYHFSSGITGLCYLGMGCGQLVGILTVASTNDRLVVYLTKKNGGVREPEFRLRPLLLSCLLIPGSMIWFGWAVQTRAHWFAVVASMFPLGLGMVSSMTPIQTYFIETFAPYGLTASAQAAATCLRMTCGAFVPLIAPPLFARLGHGWGCSVIGFIALSFCGPMAVYFMFYGKQLRERFPPRI